ncbi:hypothetical protein [Thalassobacillus sp. CUG 92003]|uniref:hypothetical protein n=1 Tax=Thalassobacillus sp. CUG 92003 TaxID=2736641 RepID=UPI0015E6313D|nr:hypothetical protein [Thalassobacillus sp. CUG 92003]
MSDKEAHDPEVLLKQLIRYYVKDQLSDLKNSDDKQNGFIFLESKTVNLLLLYLVLSMERKNPLSNERTSEAAPMDNEAMGTLYNAASDQKEIAEEILGLFKEKMNP